MKLLFCAECGDVVLLRRVRRFCECGRVSGLYRPDGAHADVSRDAQVIGLVNGDVRAALAFAEHPDAGYRTIRAWLMGRDAPRVHWQGMERRTDGNSAEILSSERTDSAAASR